MPKAINFNLLNNPVMNAKISKISELCTLLINKKELYRTFASIYKQFVLAIVKRKFRQRVQRVLIRFLVSIITKKA